MRTYYDPISSINPKLINWLTIWEFFKKNIFLMVLFCITCRADAPLRGITYSFSGGRLGDSLVAYCHAKYLEFITGIPLYYQQFTYSDQLMMHVLDIPCDMAHAGHFRRVEILNKNFVIPDRPQEPTIYVARFFCESILEREDPLWPYLFDVDWNNPAFKAILKRYISPLYPLKSPDLPKDMITVALHVRKGTGFDIPSVAPTPEKLILVHPFKWPPDSYYIEQLKTISLIFPHDKIYVYLFTDHDNPKELADYYERLVGCSRLVIDYRAAENKHNANVLEDFFALTKFDCLIRGESNFSIIASKIADYKVHIAPLHYRVENDVVTIDQVVIERNI